MMKKTQHEEYCDAIIKSIQSINPHTNQEGRVGYIYSSGFLAAYLASLMVEDPWAYKKFKRHIDGLSVNKKHKP